MLNELAQEKWSNAISVVTIGATKDDGGSRDSVIKIGGQTTLPFLFSEGQIPHRPIVAAEIFDSAPSDWPDELTKSLQGVLGDPVAWAKTMIEQCNVDLICLRLQGAHPDCGDRGPDELAALVNKMIKNIKVPFIIRGCGDDVKDNLILPAVAQATKGERCLFGNATQENYKTLVGVCLADGHTIIAESPIDINIAKQLNILINDMGLDSNKIVIDPTVGALGYGLEYAYSIMERARLATLTGDKMMAQPFICYVGAETWRAKEARARIEEFPQWGNERERGVVWEAVTATTFLLSGADILVLRHPKAMQLVKEHITKLMRS